MTTYINIEFSTSHHYKGKTLWSKEVALSGVPRVDDTVAVYLGDNNRLSIVVKEVTWPADGGRIRLRGVGFFFLQREADYTETVVEKLLVSNGFETIEWS